MELRIYYQILRRRWWIPLLTFAIVFLATLALSSRQSDMYESRATFVIRPRSEIVLDDEFVRALDIVSRRIEINTTFAEVANSRLIRESAVRQLELPPEKQQGLAVSGRVIGGTNILQITVQSTDRVVARDFANAVGVEIVNYVQSLYDVFELQPLDEANLPASPMRSRLMLNLALGAILGLGLGISLVFTLDYLQSPPQERDAFNIIDRETGVYNKSYLVHRLWQEVRRAQRNKYPLAIGMIKVEAIDAEEVYSPRDQTESLRLIRILTHKSLREEDILARFDHNTLAILLPDMTEKKAKQFMGNLRLSISSVCEDVGNGKLQLKSTVQAVAFPNQATRQERFLTQLFHALEVTGNEPDDEDYFANNHQQEVVVKDNRASHRLN
jgi:capsular polysaccharide biosynthesis protein